MPADLISPIIAALQSYPNIWFRNLNLESYVTGTPGEEFQRSGKIFESNFLVEHTSDFLRYTSLYKYGGIYLDLDVIVQKDFDALPPNFSCQETESNVGVSAMGFQDDFVAHELLHRMIRYWLIWASILFMILYFLVSQFFLKMLCG